MGKATNKLKSNKQNGFGLSALPVEQYRWYFVEFNDNNNETREIHWLKVKKQPASKRQLFKAVVNKYNNELHESLEDNLAICYVEYFLEASGFKKGFWEAFLFRAKSPNKTNSTPYPMAIWQERTYTDIHTNENLRNHIKRNVFVEHIQIL